MFIIWGFGHRTVKEFGLVSEAVCGRCRNDVQRRILKVTYWFTIFFIPIIPYKKDYLLVCPICSDAAVLSKEEFDNISQAGYHGSPILNNSDKYSGKTETQIAYLKQMEEFERDKEPAGK